MSRAAALRKPTRRPWGGLLDLVIVAATLWMVAGRTPGGALAWYAVQRARGVDSELPTLTGFFQHSTPLAVSPEDVPELPPPPPDPDPQTAELPEPWRTAALTALADPPAATRERLGDLEGLPVEEAALAWLDRAYREEGDVEAALAALALGPELRDRAIRRAVAAGDLEPERYASYRRHLPARAQRQADPVISGTMALATLLRLHWPISTPHRVSSSWGHRLHPVLRTKRFHNGVDLAVPIGTPVHAAQQGQVVAVDEDRRSGRYVIVDHGHGVRTSYCHLDASLVQVGDTVSAGTPIARSGNTGRSTGPHLHFVLRVGGRTVDPEAFRPPAGS